jgi:hypothetical protein
MAAIVEPTDEEKYLIALLFSGADGIDLSEFCWIDEERESACYRVWDYQWKFYTCEDTFQVDQMARSMGKSQGIQMRAVAFPFVHPGQDMLITAPELNHLRPLTDVIENRILSIRLCHELLPRTKGNGLARQPHWQARFSNGTRIVSRLPGKTGKGVKGQHPLVLESDEMQDYPPAGWIELVETMKRGSKGAQWRAHGVSRGVRDQYYNITMNNDDWTVHRYIAAYRPSWSAEERQEKIKQYGGSRQNPDYRRNIYGDHGDATNPVFVLARLMSCVDQESGSEYNTDIYQFIRISYEEMHGRPIAMLMDITGVHKQTWKEAPRGYSAYYGGMDVGVTNHPSEILVFGQRAGAPHEQLDLLLRLNLIRVATDDQEEAVEEVFRFYGDKLLAFGIDRTGVGFPLWERLAKKYGERLKGYNFSGKYAVALEDREMERNEKPEDLVIERNIVEFATDALREVVDAKGFLLPYDRELLSEWQGQSYSIVRDNGSPYGNKRQYSGGSFHTLDAAKMMIAGKRLHTLDEMLNAKPKHAPVLDVFMGSQ